MYKNLLVLPDGKELFSGTAEKNAIKSVKLTELVNSGNDLTIGSVCSAMMEATLYTPDGALELTSGDVLTLYKVSETGTRTKAGVFSIESPTRPTPNTMKVYGYDNVSKLDKDLSAWLLDLTAWPYTLSTFAENVCTACGLTMNPKEIPNGDMDIQKFAWAGVTGRKLMQWAGELASRFVRADPDGNIEFGWYQDTGITLGTDGKDYYFAGTLNYENFEVAPIQETQIRLKAEEGSPLWPPVSPGTEDMNRYIIGENPMIRLGSTLNPLSNLHAITDELFKVSYTPSRVAVPARLDIRAGSIVNIRDRNGRLLRMYVMEKTNSGQKDTLECKGSISRSSTTATYSRSESQKQADNQLNLVVNALRSVLSGENGESEVNLSGARLTFLHDGKETVRVENLGKGQPIIYMHDVDPNQESCSAEYSPHHIKLGGTSTQPLFEITVHDGILKIDIGDGSGYKRLSWKDNGDGTFSLIGM